MTLYHFAVEILEVCLIIFPLCLSSADACFHNEQLRSLSSLTSIEHGLGHELGKGMCAVGKTCVSPQAKDFILGC